MKLFSCPRCQQLLFFESSSCLKCSARLAYLPDRGLMSPVDPADVAPGTPGTPVLAAGVWRATPGKGAPIPYRLCRNYWEQNVCNWAVPDDDPAEYCQACRLNQIIPNLGEEGAKDKWAHLETAKRRLIYSLVGLGLPVEPRADDNPRGLAFSFMRDEADHKVWIGHTDGLITINIAEADDPFREKMRVNLGETYRTLLGHFRHEIGHYYWDRLIRDSAHLQPFRKLFGDEQQSYDEAVERHYENGPPPNWHDSFVSSYATMHPWEDWAETWAHYLHMVDTLETARAHGLSIRQTPVSAKPSAPVAAQRLDLHSFDDLMTGWIPLTVTLNSLSRSMGVPDAYPFVLSKPAVEKLKFVHGVVEAWAG